MVTHDNIYIPGESFPHWIWFVIEFIIVLAVAVVISHQIVPTLEDMVLTHNWIDNTRIYDGTEGKNLEVWKQYKHR